VAPFPDEGWSMTRHTEAQQKFSEMSAAGKIKHIGKVIVCLLTFGFVFPNIFSE
jgi:hypothetical protein